MIFLLQIVVLTNNKKRKKKKVENDLIKFKLTSFCSCFIKNSSPQERHRIGSCGLIQLGVPQANKQTTKQKEKE